MLALAYVLGGLLLVGLVVFLIALAIAWAVKDLW